MSVSKFLGFFIGGMLLLHVFLSGVNVMDAFAAWDFIPVAKVLLGVVGIAWGVLAD